MTPPTEPGAPAPSLDDLRDNVVEAALTWTAARQNVARVRPEVVFSAERELAAAVDLYREAT